MARQAFAVSHPGYERRDLLHGAAVVALEGADFQEIADPDTACVAGSLHCGKRVVWAGSIVPEDFARFLTDEEGTEVYEIL